MQSTNLIMKQYLNSVQRYQLLLNLESARSDTLITLFIPSVISVGWCRNKRERDSESYHLWKILHSLLYLLIKSPSAQLPKRESYTLHDLLCLITRHWMSHQDLSFPSTYYLKIHFLFSTPHCLLALLRPSLSLICFLNCFSAPS